MEPINRLPAAVAIPLAILIASVGALALAYTAEIAYDLEPCVLCLYQRVPYAAAAGLAAFVLLRPGSQRRGRTVVALAGAVFLAGGGIAFYHVGVEQHWWHSVAACGGGLTTEMSVAELKVQLLSKPAKACDVVDWTFLGISMAAYNVAASVALAIACFVGARRIGSTQAVR